MSLSRQTLKRLPNIKQGFLDGISYEQIAVTCEVHHRTIERDVQSWVESGLFEVWLKTEFVRLHGLKCKEGDLDKTYDNITKLVGKMITRRIEAKTEIEERKEVTVKIDGLSSEEREFAKSIAGKYIKTRNQKRSSTIH